MIVLVLSIPLYLEVMVFIQKPSKLESSLYQA